MKTLTKIIIIFFSILLFTFISENINYNVLRYSSSNKIESFMNQIIIKPASGIDYFDQRETTFSVLTYDDYSQINKYQGENELTRQPSPIKDIEEPSYVQFESSEIKEGSGISGVDIRGILGKIESLDEKMNMLIINNDHDTCNHGESREFNIYYEDELNVDSSEEDIKTYILENLERINPGAFQSSDGASITDSMKKALIIILDYSSTSIRFKFCCPTEEDCLL